MELVVLVACIEVVALALFGGVVDVGEAFVGISFAKVSEMETVNVAEAFLVGIVVIADVARSKEQ